eukprot:jgi/Tetstr1/435086/TSEL_024055.t1
MCEGDKMGHVYGDTGESWAALEKYYYGKARDRVARMEAHVARSIELGLVLDRKKRLTMTDEEVKEFEDGIEGRMEEHKEVAKLQEEFDVLLEEFEWEDDEDEDEWDLEPQDEDDRWLAEATRAFTLPNPLPTSQHLICDNTSWPRAG